MRASREFAREESLQPADYEESYHIKASREGKLCHIHPSSGFHVKEVQEVQEVQGDGDSDGDGIALRLESDPLVRRKYAIRSKQ